MCNTFFRHQSEVLVEATRFVRNLNIEQRFEVRSNARRYIEFFEDSKMRIFANTLKYACFLYIKFRLHTLIE